MKKHYLLSLLSYLVINLSYAQCDTTLISPTGFTLVSTNSNAPGAEGNNAFDGDQTTIWHTEWDATQPPYPHEIIIDLGTSYPVNGFGYIPRTTGNLNGKIAGFEFYLSTDNVTWGNAEVTSEFSYLTNPLDEQTFNFGAINAQYVKFVATSSAANEFFAVVSELNIYQDFGCGATGQINQDMTFDFITEKYTTDPAITLNASVTSGLAITYDIISGPATIIGNQLTLDGNSGIVEVRALQAGNATYYAKEIIQSFNVIDLSIISPVVTTRLSEAYDIQMPYLMAYPIYLSATIDYDNQLTLTTAEVIIDGTSYTCTEDNGFYYYLWKPATFGAHSIDIKVTADNGASTTITRNVNVTSIISDQTVTSMEDVVIEFGGTNSRWFYGSYEMPQHVNSYDEIMANLIVECPNGNCDDWDRWAHIDVKGPDGNWIQIIRYMTPYNVGCTHLIDLTDYESILQGELEFRMFIDTWGTGGWQITLDFDHQEGTPEYAYTGVEEIWDNIYDLGNPTDLQPVDTVKYTYNTGIQKSKLVVSNTGHGWGNNNSQNAAEFYNATNFIDIDNTPTFTQNLWNDCNPNPDNCTNQQGTWQYSRAGWCPGSIAHPNKWDMTSNITSNELQLTYRFDPTYTDYCHPNNPNCNSGTTCPDCNDGYKAIYIVDGHLINYANQPLVYGGFLNNTEHIDNTLNYEMSVFPNPSNGFFTMNVKDLKGTSRVFIQDISGQTLKTYYFTDQNQLNDSTFDLTSLPSGIYFISIESSMGTGVQKLIIE